MRIVTEELIKQEKFELKKLEDAWLFYNKPYTNKELKESLFTKIHEKKGEIAAMEKELFKSNKPKRKRRSKEIIEAEKKAIEQAKKNMPPSKRGRKRKIID